MDIIRKGTWRYVCVICKECKTPKELRIDVWNRLNKQNKDYTCVHCSSRLKALKHGMSINKYKPITEKTWLYRRWQAMKKRCSMYESYKSRGITVCPEWQNSFVAFKLWAESNGADPKLELDRIDNDKGYTPDNCRWVTHKENCRAGGRSGKFKKD